MRSRMFSTQLGILLTLSLNVPLSRHHLLGVSLPKDAVEILERNVFTISRIRKHLIACSPVYDGVNRPEQGAPGFVVKTDYD